MRKPKPVCPVCSRLNCSHQTHRKDARRRAARPLTWSETARRKAFLDEYVRSRGVEIGGVWYAPCQCPTHEGNRWTPRNRLVAGHVLAVALGGSEAGPLRAECRTCSDREGARLAAEARR